MGENINRFDRQLQLSDIFSTKELDRISLALSSILDCEVEIVEPEAAVRSNCQRVEILWEIETIAYIQSRNATLKKLAGCVELFLILLKEAIRYRMASELHQETVAADFATLQEKHRELQLSEMKYRDLSRQLQEKVAAQVKTIEDAQRKVFQSEKLASVGQLAAGVAHEFNSPLAYIQNNLTAAKEYLHDIESFFASVRNVDDLKAVHESWQKVNIDFILEDFPILLDSCLDGVTKIASIVSDLKVFSGVNQQQLTFGDVNERVQAAMQMLKTQAGQKIDIVQEYSELPAIECYPAYLGQVFYNLIQNAIQAIETEGRVLVKTFKRGDCICVVVSDTGKGISKADMSRIFDPFFTTKEVGTGTGLGLTVIHDIIQAHHGRIEVASTPGKGSTFTVYLPVDRGPT